MAAWQYHGGENEAKKKLKAKKISSKSQLWRRNSWINISGNQLISWRMAS
jgi:hypothetical protein